MVRLLPENAEWKCRSRQGYCLSLNVPEMCLVRICIPPEKHRSIGEDYYPSMVAPYSVHERLMANGRSSFLQSCSLRRPHWSVRSTSFLLDDLEQKTWQEEGENGEACGSR